MIVSFLIKIFGGYNNLRKRYNCSKTPFMKRLYLNLNRIYNHQTNSFLPFNNVVKGFINFPHNVYGVFISGGAEIGLNCTIYQQVTIGSNMLIDSKGLGSPIIGDNCLIGAGAKIIGNVRIGNNCRIGANAVVTKDLPDNSVIVISASNIYQKQNLINKTYSYTKNGWSYFENGLLVKEENTDVLSKLSDI
jgi:serine O-acetyltransferase